VSVPPATAAPKNFAARLFTPFLNWIDSDYCPEGPEAMRAQSKGVDAKRMLPFVAIHLGCLGVFWVGVSWFAVGVAVALYFVRMFAVTGVNHRYFSHKTYGTTRLGQFFLAIFAGTAVQRGCLWWAAYHRHHHRHSDEPEDAHSPRIHGFWWSHIGWLTSNRNKPTDYSVIPDLAKFPELIWLNRFDQAVPVVLALALYFIGVLLAHLAPGLHTSGGQLLVWGFFISTTVLFHGTACINSFAHIIGRRRYATNDDSRNSFILSIITLGEGWHNNHHRYPSATRNGFYWWEIDPTYYGLKILSWTGLIWSLKRVPASVLEEGRRTDDSRSVTT
jgi:stearoyl-CoA desaturase (delta-9 desaturase)